MNAVGVDLNTASSPSWGARLSGLGASIADAIVAHRDQTGPFASRKDCSKCRALASRTFEQCAGFLRIPNGKEPLDASSRSPEAYGVAKKIVAACGRDLRSLMGDSATLKSLDPKKFIDEQFGLPTVKDIIAELEKPGRDPRPSFKTATLPRCGRNHRFETRYVAGGHRHTNVAAFGAFVDIGVHQDGLVHVSQLADRFVKDPHEVVKAGDVVKVRVVEVDVKRKRIGLTMRKDGGEAAPQPMRERAMQTPCATRQPSPKIATRGRNPGRIGRCFG